MATSKPAGDGKRTGAAPKRAQLKTKTEGEGHRRRQGRKAERRTPGSEAAMDAWIELTALVLACGFSETGQGEWLRSPTSGAAHGTPSDPR
jgi:hypothetical protein